MKLLILLTFTTVSTAIAALARQTISDECKEKYKEVQEEGVQSYTYDPFPRDGEYDTYDDIIVPRENARHGKYGSRYLWPNGVVPYVVSDAINFLVKPLCLADPTRANISMAMTRIERVVPCVRFRPRTPRDRYNILFYDYKTGCNSSVGFQNKRDQIVNLAHGCRLKVGIIMHEIMHALGIFHEQSRPDRDDYVTVHLNRVVNSSKHNFDKEDGNTYQVPYNYASIMHYNKTDFVNKSIGGNTMDPKQNPPRPYLGTPNRIGQRDFLSRGDVQSLRERYGCPERDDETEEDEDIDAYPCGSDEEENSTTVSTPQPSRTTKSSPTITTSASTPYPDTTTAQATTVSKNPICQLGANFQLPSCK